MNDLKTNNTDILIRIVFDDDFRRSFIEKPENIKLEYDLSDEDIQMLHAFRLERIKELAEKLSEIDYSQIVAAAWCNSTTPVRE